MLKMHMIVLYYILNWLPGTCKNDWQKEAVISTAINSQKVNVAVLLMILISKHHGCRWNALLGLNPPDIFNVVGCQSRRRPRLTANYFLFLVLLLGKVKNVVFYGYSLWLKPGSDYYNFRILCGQDRALGPVCVCVCLANNYRMKWPVT